MVNDNEIIIKRYCSENYHDSQNLNSGHSGGGIRIKLPFGVASAESVLKIYPHQLKISKDFKFKHRSMWIPEMAASQRTLEKFWLQNHWINWSIVFRWKSAFRASKANLSRCPTMRCAGICACRQKQIWHISSVDLPQIWKNISLACGIAGCKHGFCMFLSGECDTTSPKCRKNQMHSNTTSREWFWFLCVLFILNARITSSLGFSPFGKE